MEPVATEEKEMEADEVTLAGSDGSDTEGSTDIEAAFEPHMKAIDAMGLLRPPLPKAPGSFRSKRERERLVRKKFARSRVRIAANIGSKTILVSLATTSAFHHPLYVQDSYQTVRPALLPQLLDIS